MKRVLRAVLLLLLCVLVGAWLAWPAMTAALRQQLERVVAEALHQPVRVETLSLTLLPVRVGLGGVTLGPEAAPAAHVGAVDAQVWLLASLLQRRPVLSGHVRSLALDLDKLIPPGSTGKQPGGNGELPALQVRSLELQQVQVRVVQGGTPAVIEAAQLAGAFEFAGREQAWNASADVNGIRLERGAAQLDVHRLQVTAGGDRHGLRLSTARLQGDGVHLMVTPRTGQREYALTAAVDLSRVAALLDEPLEGEVRFEGTLAGDLADPGVETQLSGTGLMLDGNTIGELKAHFERQGESLRLTDVEVSGPSGRLTGEATLTGSGLLPIDARVNLQAVDLDTVLRLAQVRLPLGHAVSGAADLTGTLKPLALDLHAKATALPPRLPDAPSPDRSSASVEVGLHLEDGQGAVRWDVQQPQQNRATGHLSWQQGQLAGALQANVADLAAFSRLLPQPARDLGLSGRAQGTATLSGAAGRPTLQATLTGQELSIMGAGVPRLGGAVTIAGPTLTTAGVKLETNGGGAELIGTVALGATAPNDWQLTLRAVKTDIVAGLIHAFTAAPIPVSGGDIDGDIHVRGAWARAGIKGDLGLRSVFVSGEPFARVEGDVSAELPRWRAHLSAVHAGNETLTAEGSGEGLGGEISLSSTPFQLGNFRGASQKKLVGTATIRAAISGPFRQANGSVTLAIAQLGLGGSSLGDLLVEGAGRQGEWKFHASAFERAVDAEATIRLVSGYPYTLALQTRAWDFGRLIASDESLRTALTAQLNLQGSASAWATPSGALRIAQLDIRRDQYEVRAQEAIRVDVNGGRVVIHPAVLVAPSSQLKLSGELTLAGDVDVQARGSGDLVLLELIGKPFHSAQGQFNVAVQVRHGRANGWDLSGRGQLRGAVLDIGLPIAFSDVNGDVVLTGSRVQLLNLSGKAGGGHFDASGTMALDDGLDLVWHVQDVAISTDQGLEAQVAGNGQVRGRWQAMTVSGDIEVLNALYDRNIELKDLLPSFKKQLTPPPRSTSPAVQVHLDLRIHAPGALHIDNNVAEVELGANLRITGTVDKPELTGTITFLSGEVKFKQRNFTITAGTIDFRDRSGINPVLNISAESQIATAESDYTVTVTVTGTAEDPRIQPSADDPTLSETDILSLITFGQTAAQLQRQGGGVNAYDAVALLPTGTVTGPLAKLLGVNRLEIETVQQQTSSAAGSMEPRVTIGKDLTERLRATASTAFGSTPERNVQIDYRLTRQLSVFGTWEGQTSEQSGAFGGGLRLRYEFRRMPFSLLPGGLEPETRGHER